MLLEQEGIHYVDIDVPLSKHVSQLAHDVSTAQTAGSCPPYSMFVDSLFKQMGTVEQTLLHSAVGIAGEGGEILDLVKKVWAYNKELDATALLEELGDMRFYYQAMLNLLAVTDAEIQALNITKLSKRYPDGQYSDDAAQARADKVPTSDRKFFGQQEAASKAEQK